MDISFLIVIGAMIVVTIALMAGSSYLERRHYRKHPPDWDDGFREDLEDDD